MDDIIKVEKGIVEQQFEKSQQNGVSCSTSQELNVTSFMYMSLQIQELMGLT